MKTTIPFDPFREKLHAELLAKTNVEQRQIQARQRAMDTARNAALRNRTRSTG